MKNLLWIYFFCFSFLVTSAQVSLKLSTKKITIGEPILVSIAVEKTKKDSLEISPLDSIPNFDILAIEDKKIDGKFVKEIQLTSFDQGKYTLPSFAVSINQNTYNTQPLEILVENVKINEKKQGLYNIKTIMLEHYNLWDFIQKNWVYFALFYLLLVVAFIIYLLRKKEKKMEQEIFKDLISPYDEAFFGLKKIEKYNLLQQEDATNLYVSLSFIIKRFVGRKYKINYAERLTDEFIEEINQNNILPDEEIQSLSEFLAFADLVKFAKYQPEKEKKETDFNRIFALVERHKPMYNQIQKENV